jgi:hypothetical protein
MAATWGTATLQHIMAKPAPASDQEKIEVMLEQMVTPEDSESLLMVREVCARMAANDQKFNDEHMTGKHHDVLERAAKAYLLTYKGSFDLLVGMRKDYNPVHGLSIRQRRAVLNCLLAEVRREVKAEQYEDKIMNLNAVATAPTTPEGFTVKPGLFTVVWETEQGEQIRRTIRLQKHFNEEWAKKGEMVAKYLSGPDNESSYTGFAFVSPNGQVRLWKKFEGAVNVAPAVEALKKLVASKEAMQSAGLEWSKSKEVIDPKTGEVLVAGACYRCGKTLTVPSSICAGLGPICENKAW